MTTALTARNSRCSIARTLEMIGDKWTLLVVREAFWGRTRFADFRERLGVAPDVLTDRLGKLVAAGVFETRAYRAVGERARSEYILTDIGRELLPVLASLARWGDANRATGFGPAAEFTDARTGGVLRLAFLNDDEKEIDVKHVALARGPGALTA